MDIIHDFIFEAMSPVCPVCNDSGERWVWCPYNGKDSVTCECLGGF